MSVATAPNGHRAQSSTKSRNGVALQPPQASRSKLPQLLLALVLMVGGAVAGYFIVNSAGERQSVLAVSRPVAAGEILSNENLSITRVGVDADIVVIPAEQAAQVVGRTASSALEAGELLHPTDLGTPVAIGEGEAVVGLFVGAGEIPIASLAPGDRVDIVITEGVGNEIVSNSPPAVVGATVLDAGIGLDGSSGLLVSVIVPRSESPRIARAAAADRVAVVLVGGNG